MNVANLELCKELYEISGKAWNATWLKYMSSKLLESYVLPINHINYETKNYVCEAYDLGYLLRKLPYTAIVKTSFEGYDARWVGQNDSKQFHADTPEDAAAQLAVELFKQGVLKK